MACAAFRAGPVERRVGRHCPGFHLVFLNILKHVFQNTRFSLLFALLIVSTQVNRIKPPLPHEMGERGLLSDECC